ncbi:MAG: indole-3-glycerol phosphate synthase [Candidatus Petromonas sp.]|jgi:indole-3-glycerol phosphate synthase|nr:indole-3-glycerol phosphate synthase [Candidatus Petromonas sp.]
MILDKIVDYKRKKIEEEKKEVPVDKFIFKIKQCNEIRDFKKSINSTKELGIIAEVKKASPSKGVIREKFDPVSIGIKYDKNHVQAISVLTEDKFFQGRNEYLTEIKEVTTIPLLRKDFIIDSYQIYQSRALGADAILLIASILSKEELIRFRNTAKAIGLQCLVEVHDRFELETVLEIGTDIIGINNRDLKTFKTDIRMTERLMKFIPKDKTVISESGIKSREDIQFIKELGVKGVLIGESLMRSSSIEEKLREFRGR